MFLVLVMYFVQLTRQACWDMLCKLALYQVISMNDVAGPMMHVM